MSSNRYSDWDSCYNMREISRAKANLKYEIEDGALRFLRHKLIFSRSTSYPNVWEGENGFMEHVKGTFPMPVKVDSQNSKKIDSDANCSNSSSADQSSKSHSDRNLKQKVDQTSNSPSELKHSSCESVEDIDESNKVVISQSDDDSDGDDCVILEKEKEVIEIDDDNNVSSDSNTNLSNEEVMHWQRLFKLQEEISAAKQSFRKINTMFRYNKNLVKACDAITSLHGVIIELINKLMKAKGDIDIHNFSYTLSQEIQETCFSHTTFREDATSYEQIWILLNNLFREFLRLRTKRKAVLKEHKQFANIALKQFKNSIQSIKMKKKIKK